MNEIAKLDFAGYEDLPFSLRSALRMYVEEGYMPGGFLTAVLCNDLIRAVSMADTASLQYLPLVTKFVWNRVPQAAYGSAERMRDYVDAVWDAKRAA